MLFGIIFGCVQKALVNSDFFNTETVLCIKMETAFLLDQKKYYNFCDQGKQPTKKNVNTAVFDSRNAKIIGICSGPFYPRVSRTDENTADSLSFRGPRKCDNKLCCHLQQQQQQQQQQQGQGQGEEEGEQEEQEEEEHTQNSDKKMRGRM